MNNRFPTRAELEEAYGDKDRAVMHLFTDHSNVAITTINIDGIDIPITFGDLLMALRTELEPKHAEFDWPEPL